MRGLQVALFRVFVAQVPVVRILHYDGGTMLSLYRYTINGRSGRPEPHRSWAMISVYAAMFWFGAAMFAVMACYYSFWRNRPDGGLAAIFVASIFAAIALVVGRFLRKRKRELSIAVGDYRDALRRALD